jgi:hypothetical protein
MDIIENIIASGSASVSKIKKSEIPINTRYYCSQSDFEYIEKKYNGDIFLIESISENP